MTKKISNPHDRYFQEQFSRKEFALSFFQENLPSEIRTAVDWKHFQLCSGDFVRKALQNRKSDLLYKTKIKDRDSYFYLHLEHQRKSDPTMAYRILVYMVNILEQNRKQFPKAKEWPLVFPMVLYQGKKEWLAPTKLHDLLRVPKILASFIPQFQYALVDLSRLSDEEIKGKVALRLAMLVMKHIDSPEITSFLHQQLFPLIQQLLEKETGLEYIETMLYYLSNTSDYLDKAEVIEIFQELPDNRTKKVVMTLAEQWKLEGQEKGQKIGEKIGQKKGEARLIQKLLKLKFGDEATEYNSQLSEFTLEQLDQVSERILVYQNIDEIFKGI
ncbi:MAG: hypothetical protein COB67_13920 [SAR324 cluster bacterium]|uniref:Transposase (putative) YhgA-like domain-containing protein n=1 Tax=SAR324 cluster bacterium TaxID=2024889 RepID=A0A2A4SJR4_9DELT|nr:MAG: hypothetical protein COB67_13920 [SAR324 cluster bacterium]